MKGISGQAPSPRMVRAKCSLHSASDKEFDCLETNSLETTFGQIDAVEDQKLASQKNSIDEISLELGENSQHQSSFTESVQL